jgi:hypothetical protein
MATESTEELIKTGYAHLARFAFHTRDNPFIKHQASLSFDETNHEELVALLDGEVRFQDWLRTKTARRLLRAIEVGSVPRDVDLLVRQGEKVVGVDSVHAFLHAPLFWWLVSILWCIAVSQAVDPLLAPGIRGYRFRKDFLRDPSRAGLMFEEQRAAQKRWKEFPQEVREGHPGDYVTNATLDLRAFYYAIDAGPREITRRFFASHGKRSPATRRLRVLADLLEQLHRRYAQGCSQTKPRIGYLDPEGASPLPVGLPSSQVLGNMIISMALGELQELEDVVAVAAYADDITVMTTALPELREKPVEFLARLGLCGPESPHALHCESTRQLGGLVTGEEKMAVSYSRYLPPVDEEAEQAVHSFLERLGIAADDWAPSFADDNADWGGRLGAVLRSANRRERIPTQLRDELLALLDEVRVGLSPEETAKRFEEFFVELDRRLIVALRPYWCELIVVAVNAKGLRAVDVLTKQVAEIVETVQLPDGAPGAGYEALRFGLRQSWYQALAQAIAVVTDAEDRKELSRVFPKVTLGRHSLRMKAVIARAGKIRKRRLISPTLVAVPLAEFSDWKGALIGPRAFDRFLAWTRGRPPSKNPELLAERVEGSLRFINLHEACLAIHLWAGHAQERWLDEAFAVLRGQPLIDAELVDELWEGAEAAIDPPVPSKEERSKRELAELQLRVGMPSMQIPPNQLRAMAKGETAQLEAIASDLRRSLKGVVRSARKTTDVLVLPEWAILPQLLPWLMDQSARRQIFVVGGQTPEIVGSQYRNRLWAGVPLLDSASHRACLVTPPRQKRFLSPHEEEEMDKRKLKQVKSKRKEVRPIGWRGVRIGSLLCFEFADIELRRRMRFAVDVLTVSSLNRDWRYFDVVQDSTSRDNYCLTICVNTGAFPGTRIVRPTKSEMAVAASVHGSDRPALITKGIDMLPIVLAQANGETPKKIIAGYKPHDGMRLKDYKPFPPGRPKK